MTAAPFAALDQLTDMQAFLLGEVLMGRDLYVPAADLEPLAAAGFLVKREEEIEAAKSMSGAPVRIVRYGFPGAVAAIRFRKWHENYQRRTAPPCYRIKEGRVEKGPESEAAKARVALTRLHEAFNDAAEHENKDYAALGRAHHAWIAAVMREAELPECDAVDMDQALRYREVYAEAIAINSIVVMVDREFFRALLEEWIRAHGGDPTDWRAVVSGETDGEAR